MRREIILKTVFVYLFSFWFCLFGGVGGSVKHKEKYSKRERTVTLDLREIRKQVFEGFECREREGR